MLRISKDFIAEYCEAGMYSSCLPMDFGWKRNYPLTLELHREPLTNRYLTQTQKDPQRTSDSRTTDESVFFFGIFWIFTAGFTSQKLRQRCSFSLTKPVQAEFNWTKRDKAEMENPKYQTENRMMDFSWVCTMWQKLCQKSVDWFRRFCRDFSSSVSWCVCRVWSEQAQKTRNPTWKSWPVAAPRMTQPATRRSEGTQAAGLG